MSKAAESLVTRVSAVLRGLSALDGEEATTTRVADSVDLPRPTVHRLLTALAEEGLVDRDADSGRWFLGPELYVLGAAAASRYAVTPQVRRVVSELARQTKESAFFSVLRGTETVCLVREDGSFPLRSHVLHEGIRLPLGVASAGLAVLSHLPEVEVGAYLREADLVAAWGPEHAEGPLRRRIEQTRRDGYATNPGLIVEGSWGMGAAVFDGFGRPRGALSLTGVESRFAPARRRELGRALLDAAHGVSAVARSSPWR